MPDENMDKRTQEEGAAGTGQATEAYYRQYAEAVKAMDEACSRHDFTCTEAREGRDASILKKTNEMSGQLTRLEEKFNKERISSKQTSDRVASEVYKAYLASRQRVNQVALEAQQNATRYVNGAKENFAQLEVSAVGAVGEPRVIKAAESVRATDVGLDGENTLDNTLKQLRDAKLELATQKAEVEADAVRMQSHRKFLIALFTALFFVGVVFLAYCLVFYNAYGSSKKIQAMIAQANEEAQNNDFDAAYKTLAPFEDEFNDIQLVSLLLIGENNYNSLLGLIGKKEMVYSLYDVHMQLRDILYRAGESEYRQKNWDKASEYFGKMDYLQKRTKSGVPQGIYIDKYGKAMKKYMEENNLEEYFYNVEPIINEINFYKGYSLIKSNDIDSGIAALSKLPKNQEAVAQHSEDLIDIADNLKKNRDLKKAYALYSYVDNNEAKAAMLDMMLEGGKSFLQGEATGRETNANSPNTIMHVTKIVPERVRDGKFYLAADVYFSLFNGKSSTLLSPGSVYVEWGADKYWARRWGGFIDGQKSINELRFSNGQNTRGYIKFGYFSYDDLKKAVISGKSMQLNYGKYFAVPFRLRLPDSLPD